MNSDPSKKLLILSVCCIFALLTGAHAAGKKISGRVAYIVCSNNHAFFANPITVQTGKSNQQIQLSKRSASGPVKIPADGQLLFKSSKDSKEPFARVVIPEQMKKALVILTPVSEDGKDSFLVQSIDLAQFKKGNWLFVNQTTSEILVKMGDEKLNIKPTHFALFKTSKLIDSKSVSIPLSYSYLKGDQWKILSSSTVVIYATRREICIFNLIPKSKRITYHGITFSERN